MQTTHVSGHAISTRPERLPAAAHTTRQTFTGLSGQGSVIVAVNFGTCEHQVFHY